MSSTQNVLAPMICKKTLSLCGLYHIFNMSFKDDLLKLSKRVAEQHEKIMTEEATKTSFVLPFIQILGYDIFNPYEVEPEHTCDFGTKKGEKIDYAIKRNGEVVLLVECKHWRENLDFHINQLFRYYVVSEARFAILTNGIKYRFFSDSMKPNVMDAIPFLEFDITYINEWHIEQLLKFSKPYFNELYIHDTISGIKHICFVSAESDRTERQLKNQLAQSQIEADRTEQQLKSQLAQSRQEIESYSQKIVELENALRAREEKAQQVQNDGSDDLTAYLNMPVPYNWRKMNSFTRKNYWKGPRDAWCGEPRDKICTTEVVREFYEIQRGEATYKRSREVSDAIRATGLFTQTSKRSRFGEYGVALTWVRINSGKTRKKTSLQ
jgi:hypothetical protein